MATDDADPVPLSERTARLAELIDEVETDGTTVVDYDTQVSSDALFATVEVRIEEGPTPRIVSASYDDTRIHALRSLASPGYSSLRSAREAFEDVDAADDLLEVSGMGEHKARRLADAGYETVADLEAATQKELVDVQGVGPAFAARIKADVGGVGGCVVDHDSLDAGGECPDCDYVAPLPGPDGVDAEGVSGVEDESVTDATATPETADQEDVDDQADTESDQDDRSAEAQIVDLLEAEGELPSSEIKLVTERTDSHIHNTLSKLQDEGRVEARQDPDDGRRNLYRLADQDVVEDVPDYEGPDPHEVVLESDLPTDRVTTADVLDAVVDAARADAPVLSVVTDQLGVHSDAIQPVLRELGLQEADNRFLVDDVGAKVAAIREVADA